MITLFLNQLNNLLKECSYYKELLKETKKDEFSLTLEGPEGFFLAYLIHNLFEKGKGTLLIVTPTELEAKNLVSDLSLLTDKAYAFPWWDKVPYSGNRVQPHIASDRIHYLVQMLKGDSFILVVGLRAFLTPVPPPELIRASLFPVKVGDEFDPLAIQQRLIQYGYLKVPKVTVPGEFALRGEVLDLFLGGEAEPIRIVFEWDEVERITTFDPDLQKSTAELEQVLIHPLREILWSEERFSLLEEELPVTAAKDAFLIDLRERKSCRDEENFFAASFKKPASLVDYLDSEAMQILFEDDRLFAGAATLKKEYQELYRKARSEGVPAPKAEHILLDYQDLVSIHGKTITIPALRDNQASDRIRIPVTGPRSFFGNIQYLKSELENLKESGYRITIFAESESQAVRIRQLIADQEIDILAAPVSSGFSLPESGIMAIQENEIFGRRKRVPASVKKAKTSVIDTFVELNPGDYVVHVNYGIGKFLGIDRITAAGTERDYIKLEYSDQEMIFIPIEQVNLVQRYIGAEGQHPRLDKLGGRSWEGRKARVRQSVEDLAERLILLYARRRDARGFAFAEDTDWQIEFEAEFPFQETADQLRCIEEVKADMESDRPMDRLVCGDVGYGKTEIAMRAAFKAVVEGKQVALLAPTTILAEQHWENFQERFKRYPVKIAMISRFVSRKQQQRVLAGAAAGEVDLLIGTHRILQKDVLFKNLGLIVVDEEQRFGVKDKERLKEIKNSVDSLSLSATPIPRTLHMSLLKIRDISLLTTPPHNRRPIETTIQEFDEEMIAQAVRKELARGGQIFYLHNRVETLPQVRRFLEKLVPEASVELAHGKMSSSQLEDIMHRFIHGSFQLLVATTIIENGIDISNVNTIIIDRADMYGISQLYQLRGRVGRSDRSAYAYLFYPERQALSEIAMKRLQIISDNTELGSGFKIAMKDMEVRGAGNLLGRQQHGEILSVGFDMYLRILDEAVADLRRKDGDEEPQQEVYLELDYSGFVPDSYIDDPTEKMEVYKKIASIQMDEDLQQVVSELHDRFGPIPDEVLSLLAISEIRIFCRRMSIASLKERKGHVEVEFARVSRISAEKVVRMIAESGGSVGINPKKPNILTMDTNAIGLKEKSEFIREKLQALI
jgi:transcription-repair coupling factor (superfamily II helicase)